MSTVPNPWFQIAEAILFETAAPIGIGASLNQDKVNLFGYRRVVGMYHLPAGAAGPAAGFPRVRQSMDGALGVWDITDVIPLDPTQLPELVFRFDITLTLAYVAIEYTQGAVAAASLRAFAAAMPM